MTFPLSNLRAFEAAARLLSFTLAAEELHLSQSAVSQQIKQLETRLGFRLFIRMTRRLELTHQGMQLYEAVRRALNDLDLAVETLRGEAMQGRVVVSAGSSFTANWLIPRLSDFYDAHPDIELQIQPSDKPIDLQSEPSIDLMIRFGAQTYDGLIAAHLDPEQVFVVASPQLLRKNAAPEDVEHLSRFTLLHNEASDRVPGAAGDWSHWLQELGLDGTLDTTPGPRFSRSDLVVQAAVYGQGLALAWETMVVKELAENRLVKVFDGLYETTSCYTVWCAPLARKKPKVAAVLNG